MQSFQFKAFGLRVPRRSGVSQGLPFPILTWKSEKGAYIV